MEIDDMPPPLERNMHDSDSDYTDDDDEVDEANDDMQEKTLCLFCEKVLSCIEDAINHLDNEHRISLVELKHKFQMDQYSFLKLINFIRLNGVTAEKLAETEIAFWNDDEKYLKAKKYEPWLTYDYDELPEPPPNDNNTEGRNLVKIVAALQEKVKQQELLLEQASEDMNKMRVGFQRLLEKENPSNPKTGTMRPLQEDTGYFNSYAHFGIHHEMLSDVVRTTTYRDALLKNRQFVSGKSVLDVGCGTSVLSIFASQAGAKTVVGIDNSDIIYNAMDIVKQNNIENVTLIKGRLEETELPQQKYDIIISEWMGYFLLFEGMLDSIIHARDKHLQKGGMILPNRCTMSLIGYGSDELFKNHVTFWNDVYGLDMSNMRKTVMHEPLIEIVDPTHILTEPNTIADFNLNTVKLNYSNFSYSFNLKCTKDGNLTAFVGYFDTFFDLPEKVMFGTSPNDKPTHWKQVVFFLDEPQTVKADETVSGKLICQRSRSNTRSLDVTIEAYGKRFTYYLD